MAEGYAKSKGGARRWRRREDKGAARGRHPCSISNMISKPRPLLTPSPSTLYPVSLNSPPPYRPGPNRNEKTPRPGCRVSFRYFTPLKSFKSITVYSNGVTVKTLGGGNCLSLLARHSL